MSFVKRRDSVTLTSPTDPLDVTMTAPSYSLFCIGNPLLDMQVNDGEDLLEKYSLNANDAILAESKHTPMSAAAPAFAFCIDVRLSVTTNSSGNTR